MKNVSPLHFINAKISVVEALFALNLNFLLHYVTDPDSFCRIQ